MTSRERFLAAVRNQVPDRVPVSPDISNYIPCKRTRLPFWDIYFYNKIPLWKAYAEAMAYFGGDWWMGASVGAPLIWDESKVDYKVEDHYRLDLDAMVRRTTMKTPDGVLTQETTCRRYEPPTPNEKPLKNIPEDFRKYKWTMVPPVGIDMKEWQAMRAACDKHSQPFGVYVSYPGFQHWIWAAHGGVEALTYAYVDCPEILDEWYDLQMQQDTRTLELILDAQPDYVLFGGSGTITLASPELAKKYAIPALAKWSRMCREAGVATMLHSCGKSRVLVDLLCDHTEVDLINPLEHPPMGDVTLAEVKQARGRQIALMGNLHTTEVMLFGSPDLVRERSLQAMADAGEGGGFILSTGDQCGRETPEENLFAMIETAKQYGVYDRRTGRLPALEEALAVAAER